MAEKINIPSNTAICDKNGNVSIEWRLWFNKIYNRAGGADSMSNSELLAQINQTLETINGINTRIDGVESEVDTINASVVDLNTRLTTDESNIDSLGNRVATAETNITTNTNAVTGLTNRVTTAENNITTNTNAITGLTTRVSTAETNITTNTNAITNLTTRVSTAETNITNNTNAIANTVQTITNVGTGIGLYKDKTANNANFKTIKAGSNVTFDTTDPNTLVINASGGSGGSSTLATLTDVSLSTPQKGQVLVFDGVKWVNDPLWYKSHVDKLRAYWKPSNFSAAALSIGTWNGQLHTNNILINSALVTKYGKWITQGLLGLFNGTSAGITSTVYTSSGAANFSRNGLLRCVVYFTIGVIPQTTVTYGTNNTVGFCSILTSATNGNGINANNDFSAMQAETIGVGWSTALGHTNLQVIFRNTAGTLIFIDTGFPVPNELAGNKAQYEIYFDNLGTANNVSVTLNRVDTGQTYNTIIQPFPQTIGSLYVPSIQLRSIGAVDARLAYGDILCYNWFV